MAMALDKGEWGGTAAAVLLHVAVIAALTTSLAKVAPTPEPKPMEVEFVDSPEVALTSAAPASSPPPAAAAPAPASDIAEASPPPPLLQPLPPPSPQPSPLPQTRAAPIPQTRSAPPSRPASPQQPAARPLDSLRLPAAPRRSQLGDDFLKGIGDTPSRKPAQAAASYSPEAKASVASAIAAQAQRCANRQPFLGEGADQIRLEVRLSLTKSGDLLRPPVIVAVEGPSDLQAKYGDRLEDQVRAIYADCAPYRLPPELYDTASGGWRQTVIRYRVKK